MNVQYSTVRPICPDKSIRLHSAVYGTVAILYRIEGGGYSIQNGIATVRYTRLNNSYTRTLITVAIMYAGHGIL